MNFSVPLASGRDADVFAIDADRVLRRYRDGGDVAAEAAVMVYLAECGFPVPTVYQAAGTDLVMERLAGPTLLTALRTTAIEVSPAAVLLADLHHRLHQVSARLSGNPADRVLHLDLHPDNVLLGPGPVVIDWRNADEGPPDLDVAMTALIMAQVAIGDVVDLAAIASALLPAFLKEVAGQPLRQLDHALAIRRADPNLTPREVEDLARAGILVRENA